MARRFLRATRRAVSSNSAASLGRVRDERVERRRAVRQRVARHEREIRGERRPEPLRACDEDEDEDGDVFAGHAFAGREVLHVRGGVRVIGGPGFHSYDHGGSSGPRDSAGQDDVLVESELSRESHAVDGGGDEELRAGGSVRVVAVLEGDVAGEGVEVLEDAAHADGVPGIAVGLEEVVVGVEGVADGGADGGLGTSASWGLVAASLVSTPAARAASRRACQRRVVTAVRSRATPAAYPREGKDARAGRTARGGRARADERARSSAS